MRCAIVVEKGPMSYGDYLPDVPASAVAADGRYELVRESFALCFL